MGLGFLAVIISYLPVLYSGFSNLEKAISKLDAHAGSPPTASELLARSRGEWGELAGYLSDWEELAADLLESFISYPVLAYFRSQHADQSWLSALVAVLDTCVLLIATGEGGRRVELTFAMARHALADLADLYMGGGSRGSGRDRLPGGELARLRARIEFAGARLRWEGTASAIARRRALYEPHAEALSRYFLLDLPPFVGSSGQRDAWERGPHEL